MHQSLPSITHSCNKGNNHTNTKFLVEWSVLAWKVNDCAQILQRWPCFLVCLTNLASSISKTSLSQQITSVHSPHPRLLLHPCLSQLHHWLFFCLPPEKHQMGLQDLNLAINWCNTSVVSRQLSIMVSHSSCSYHQSLACFQSESETQRPVWPVLEIQEEAQQWCTMCCNLTLSMTWAQCSLVLCTSTLPHTH